VHAGRPQVADDVDHAGGAFHRGGLLGQLALDGGGTLVEHLEGAPGGAVARDLVRGQPLVVDEAGEVGAGVGAGVQLVCRQAVDRRQGAFVQGDGRGVRGIGGGIGRGGVAVAGRQGDGHGERKQEDLGLLGGHWGLRSGEGIGQSTTARLSIGRCYAAVFSAAGVEGNGWRPPVRQALLAERARQAVLVGEGQLAYSSPVRARLIHCFQVSPPPPWDGQFPRTSFVAQTRSGASGSSNRTLAARFKGTLRVCPPTGGCNLELYPMTFETLGLAPALLRALAEAGYNTP